MGSDTRLWVLWWMLLRGWALQKPLGRSSSPPPPVPPYQDLALETGKTEKEITNGVALRTLRAQCNEGKYF